MVITRFVIQKAAINEGMGGLYSREKEIWLGTEIENYFKSYKDVKPEELEDYVGTMIENEFDTYFEDGSILEICKLFCKAYTLHETDPNAPMFQALKRIPPASSKVSNTALQNGETCTADNVATTADNVATTIDNVTTTADNVATQLNELEIKDPEDEGWTVVNRKHRS